MQPTIHGAEVPVYVIVVSNILVPVPDIVLEVALLVAVNTRVVIVPLITLGMVLLANILTLILVRVDHMLQIHLVVMEYLVQYQKHVLAVQLLVCAILVKLVHQVHLITVLYTALVMEIAVVMEHMNLVKKSVAEVDVILLQVHLHQVVVLQHLQKVNMVYGLEIIVA